jgi:hypothetical protein
MSDRSKKVDVLLVIQPYSCYGRQISIKSKPRDNITAARNGRAQIEDNQFDGYKQDDSMKQDGADSGGNLRQL